MKKLISQIRKYDKLRTELEKIADSQSSEAEDLRRRAVALEKPIRQGIETFLTVGTEQPEPLHRLRPVREPEGVWWPIECFAELI